MTTVGHLGRAAAQRYEMELRTGAEEAPPEVEAPTVTNAANARESYVDAGTGIGARSMALGPDHASRPELYGRLTNEVLAKAGYGTPITGQDQSLHQALAAPITNRFGFPFSAVHQFAVMTAARKETEHAGLIAALDLPANYKNVRAGAFSVRPDSEQAKAVATKLQADPQGMAALQANADLGMEAAREMVAHGLTKEQLFAQSPDLAKTYAADPAFHEGFDAYVYAVNFSRGDLPAIHARLDQESIANQRALAYMSFPA